MVNFGTDRDANANPNAQAAAGGLDGTEKLTVLKNGKPRQTNVSAVASVAGTGNGNATKLQNVAIDNGAPNDGDMLEYVASTQKWTPKARPVPHHALIAGGAAGNRTVTGILTTDRLDEVIYYVGAGTAVTDIQDLTAEFTISAANTINNTSGTASTGGKLMVRYTRNP